MHARQMLAAVVTTWVAAIGGLLLSGTRTVTAAQAPTQGEGYYTEAQATRGKAQFNRYCAMCHTIDGSTTTEQLRTGRGLRIGRGGRALMNLGGSYLKRSFEGHPDYPSVYYLFNRIREAMPGFGADTVGIDAKVDIVAYLLSAHGLPPGPTELTAEVGAMKRMPINPAAAPDETGFEPLFNGRDFAGFKFLLGPNCKPAPEGCGKTDPGSVFRVEGGEIICTGKTQGYMYTEQKYLNFTLRFDYRFEPPLDWDYEDGVVFYGNSGHFLFINDHQVWPKGVQIEGYHRRPLIPLPMDTRILWTEEPGAIQKAMRPLGAWNSVEIVSRNGRVKSSLNGILTNTITEHEFTEPGTIGFQSEGSEIHWRNIRIKAE